MKQINKEPLYLFLTIGSQRPVFSFDVKNSKDTVPKNVVIYDKDVPNLSPDQEEEPVEEEKIHQLPEDSSSQSEEVPEPPPPTESTPEPPPTTESTPEPPPTTESTPEPPPPPTTESTPAPPATTEPTLEPPKPSSPTVQIQSTPEDTPDATWEGDWDDPPGVIIRGNDIPEIQETHPPIQTNYIKTEVPKVTKFINVSCGTGVIVAIVILTVLNIARTIRRIKVHGNETFSNNDEFEDLSSSFLLYSSEVDSFDAFIAE